jgi:hypothetical protein
MWNIQFFEDNSFLNKFSNCCVTIFYNFPIRIYSFPVEDKYLVKSLVERILRFEKEKSNQYVHLIIVAEVLCTFLVPDFLLFLTEKYPEIKLLVKPDSNLIM